MDAPVTLPVAVPVPIWETDTEVEYNVLVLVPRDDIGIRQFAGIGETAVPVADAVAIATPASTRKTGADTGALTMAVLVAVAFAVPVVSRLGSPQLHEGGQSESWAQVRAVGTQKPG